MASPVTFVFKTDPQNLDLASLAKLFAETAIRQEGVTPTEEKIDKFASTTLQLLRNQNPGINDAKLRKLLLKHLKFVDDPTELAGKIDRGETDQAYEALRQGDPQDLQLNQNARSAYLNGFLQKPDFCFQCKNTAKKLMRCGVCHFAGYCNRTCQTAHWPTHKKACFKRQPVVSESK